MLTWAVGMLGRLEDSWKYCAVIALVPKRVDVRVGGEGMAEADCRASVGIHIAAVG
jgi:hypothetical protein